LGIKATRVIAFKSFLDDGRQRLIPHQHFAVAATLLVFVADGRLEDPIAVHATRTHPIKRLFGILAALVLRHGRQCELVSISRASFYRQPVGETPENLELMRIIDEAFMEMPWYGSRQMARHLRRQGWCVGRKRVRRLMRKIGLSPIYQAPKTSEPHPRHRIYPYLLRHLSIERPN